MTKSPSKPQSSLSVQLLAICGAFALLFPGSAHAGVCNGVRHLAGSSDPALLAVLSAQAGHPVGLSGIYRQGTWGIYEITLNGDIGHLFFNGPPRRSPKVFLWGGSAQPDEYADILADVRHHVPHIPGELARCFVSMVTGRR